MGFRDDFDNAVRGGFCSLFNSADDLNRFGAGLLGERFLREAYPNTTPGIITNNGIAFFCDRPPIPPAPSNGSGQCNAQYRLRAFITYTSPFDQAGERTELFGENDSNTYTGPLGDDSPLVSGGGKFTIEFSNIAGRIDGPFFTGGQPSYRLALERVDGQPDECNADGTPVEPLPIPDRTTPIIIGDINAQLAVGNGIVQVNGDVLAPIRVNSPEIDVTGTINLTNNTIIINPTAPGNGGCCDVGIPDSDDDIPPDDDDDDDDGIEPVIVGAIVRTTNISTTTKLTSIFQENTPDYYVPALGYVAFKLRVGKNICWTSEIPIKNRNQYVQNPTDFEAIAVAGTPWLGVEWSITPVRAIVEPLEFT